jgi:hypothetical protein
MPSHTVPSALILVHSLHFGAPWTLDAWISIKSNPAPHGLFPSGTDPHTQPRNMTQSEVQAVRAYFEAFLAKDERERHKFAIGRPSDNFDNGRKKWKKWSHDAWKAMRWSDRIDKLLEAEGYHPNQLYRIAGSSATSIDIYAPVWNKLADMIFGSVAFVDTPSGQILHPGWQATVKAILGMTIRRCSLQWKRTRTMLINITAEADRVMEGEHAPCTCECLFHCF